MLSKLTKPVTFHVRNALKQHTQQQTQKAGPKRRTRENFENALEEKVFGAPKDYAYESVKRLRSACSMALLACPDGNEAFWNKVYAQDHVTMRDIRKKLKIEYHMKEPEHLLAGVFNPKVQPGMQSSEESHTCSCKQHNLKEAYIVTHQDTGECILLGSKCIELMSDVPKEAKGKFKEHRRHTLNKQIIPTKWQIRMAMVCRAAIMEAVKSGRISREEWEQSEMHGDDFYDSKWNKDSISDWIGTWYNSKRIRPAKEIWNRFPRAMASEMLEDWKKGIDKSDYSTPNVTGFRKASSVVPSVIPPREPGTLFAATPNTSASKRRFFRYSGRLRGREALNLPWAPSTGRVYSEDDFRELIQFEDITEPWKFVEDHGGRMKEGNGGWELVGLHSYHSVGDKWLYTDFMKAGIYITYNHKPDEAEVLRALKWKFPGHSDAEYANGVRDCLEHYEDSLASRPAPQKRVRELLVTQPQAPAPKKMKAEAPKPRKPMQWDKVMGGHNGQFFEWDSRQRKMVSTDDDISELSFHLNLNEKEGDSWDDIVWWAYPDGTRRTLVIQPAYSFLTAYGAHGTTGHYLIIKPDKDKWTRRELYSAIERAFVEDKESDGTANPKPRLCLSRYNHHPFLEGLYFLSGRFFQVDGKNVPVLQCRWGS